MALGTGNATVPMGPRVPLAGRACAGDLAEHQAILRNPQDCIWLSKCHLPDHSLASWLVRQLLWQFQLLCKAVHSSLGADTGQNFYGGEDR